MKTILLADDHKNIREFCRQELEDEGYRVLLARDGQEAVDLVGQEHPDVAVLDICMPQGNGLEAIERIRQIAPALPVVFFTAHDEACLEDRRSRWAVACVEKCEDLSELKRVIGRLVSSEKASSALSLGLPPHNGMEGVAHASTNP